MRKFEIRWEHGKAYWFLIDQHGQDIARSFVGYPTTAQCHDHLRMLWRDFSHAPVKIYEPPVLTPPPDPDAEEIARAEGEGMIS